MKHLYKILDWRDNPYEISVFLFIGSYKQYITYHRRARNDYYEDGNIPAAFHEIVVNRKKRERSSFIWMPEYNHTIDQMSTLCHECLHSAIRILEIARVRLNMANHESLAYLQGYIFKRALLALKDDNRIIPKNRNSPIKKKEKNERSINQATN